MVGNFIFIFILNERQTPQVELLLLLLLFMPPNFHRSVGVMHDGDILFVKLVGNHRWGWREVQIHFDDGRDEESKAAATASGQ